MTTHLAKLVSELPEIYQTIFGHPEWDGEAARDCNERLGLITQQYGYLSRELGRPLRVLDLGCAQGFFSFSLAARGASVVGVDFQQENIHVCQALADENPDLDVSFRIGRIEDTIEALKADQFDLAIGLSVFHHIVHLHGVTKVKRLLSHLASCTQAMILELAVKEEPLFWRFSQPQDPRELIEQCAFYRLMGQFNTHLSPVPRPMYLISNTRVILEDFNQPFERWQDHPYSGAGFAHKKSRRYYFGENYVCKVFYYSPPNNLLTDEEGQRNREELSNEAEILTHPPREFKTPALLAYGNNDHFGWLVMEKLSGRLLSDMLRAGEALDREKILQSLLVELVKLEKQGLWHDDIRLWNIMVDDQQKASLIDFGSIVNIPRDCSWPLNIFQSFFIFVNELFDEQRSWKQLWRSAPIHPFNLPQPWSNWLYAVWQKPVNAWSFTLLEQLFKTKDRLPVPESNISAIEQWIVAQETVLLENQTRQRDEAAHREQLSQQLYQLNTQVSQLQQDMVALAQARTESETFVAPETGPESLPTEIATLQEQLAAAHREIDHLSNINNELYHEIAKIHHSRSWRMTRGYRYAGLQIYLLRQYGFSLRCKHLIKRSLQFVFSFLRKHPNVKHSVGNALYKLGLYQPAYQLYRRMNPLPESHEQANEHKASHTELQILHPEWLPPAVHEIYLKLTKNK